MFEAGQVKLKPSVHLVSNQFGFSFLRVMNVITKLFPSLVRLLENTEPADCPFISNMRTVIFYASNLPFLFLPFDSLR